MIRVRASPVGAENEWTGDESALGMEKRMRGLDSRKENGTMEKRSEDLRSS